MKSTEERESPWLSSSSTMSNLKNNCRSKFKRKGKLLGSVMDALTRLFSSPARFAKSLIQKRRPRRAISVTGDPIKGDFGRVTCDDGSDSRAWAALPQELLEMTERRLHFGDLVRFSATCTDWRSVVARSCHHRALRFPWLVLKDPKTGSWGFLSLMEGHVHTVELLVARGARCAGSSEGWLVMRDGVRGHFLLHPFRGVRVQLPPVHELPLVYSGWNTLERRNRLRRVKLGPRFLHKVILSPVLASDAASIEDRLVIVVYHRVMLAVCRPRDAAWSIFERGQQSSGYEDAVFWQGRAYAVSTKMQLVNLEFDPEPRIRGCKVAPPTVERKHLQDRTIYLVVAAGELLMVVRFWDIIPAAADHHSYHPGKTTHFIVFKLDRARREWIEVKSLGDWMLFVGTGSSKSCRSAADCVDSGYMGNRIYYTDDNFRHLSGDDPYPCHDLGSYCLEDASIRPYIPSDSYSLESPPIWFGLDPQPP